MNTMSNLHIMIDIETLATTETALVVQVGAVKFDPMLTIEQNKEIPNRHLQVNFDITKQECGLIDSNTLQFWFEQDPEVIKSVFTSDNPASPEEGIKLIKDWIGPDKHEFWALPPGFDIRILNTFFETYGFDNLCGFREENDARTIRKIMNLHAVPLPKSVGKKHNALDDAINQANMVIKFFNIFGDGVVIKEIFK